MKIIGSGFLVTFLVLTGASLVISQTVTINPAQKYQTMEGFGAAIAYYDNWITAHPNKAEIYKLIFADLGLDILRLANWYKHPDFTAVNAAEIVREANSSLGHPIKVLMCNWSPPAELKSTGAINNGGTLRKVNNQYDYAGYAQYWYDALAAYQTAGVTPDWISIQNEPDWSADWATCLWSPTETASQAGYGTALTTVYTKLQTLTNPPKLIGPEPTGIADRKTQSYTAAMTMTQVVGVAYHLYNGGDKAQPDSYQTALQGLATDYSTKPRFMTEFSGGTWLQTAWLVHDNLVDAGASAYIYWNLIWDATGMVGLDNPWNAQSTWKNPSGYVINEDYYAIKHFSKFVDNGWKRIAATGASGDIKATAFVNPREDSLTVVALNSGSAASTFKLTLNSFTVGTSAVYQSTGASKWKSLGTFFTSSGVSLPAQSATTIALVKAGTGVLTRSVGVSGIAMPAGIRRVLYIRSTDGVPALRVMNGGAVHDINGRMIPVVNKRK